MNKTSIVETDENGKEVDVEDALGDVIVVEEDRNHEASSAKVDVIDENESNETSNIKVDEVDTNKFNETSDVTSNEVPKGMR